MHSYLSMRGTHVDWNGIDELLLNGIDRYDKLGTMYHHDMKS